MASWRGQKNRQESKRKNIKKKRKRQLLRSRSIPTDLWTITEKNFLLADISSCSLFIMVWRWIPSAERSDTVTNLNMTWMRSSRTWSTPESWSLPAKLLLSRLHSNSWRHQPMNSMISTAPFLSLQKSVILYSLKFTKTVSSWGRETIKFFIMIAQTTTSRLNRKTVIKSMERAKNTDRILSFRWDCLPMETGFH